MNVPAKTKQDPTEHLTILESLSHAIVMHLKMDFEALKLRNVRSGIETLILYCFHSLK